MKFSLITLLIAGTGLVQASPLKLTVTVNDESNVSVLQTPIEECKHAEMLPCLRLCMPEKGGVENFDGDRFVSDRPLWPSCQSGRQSSADLFDSAGRNSVHVILPALSHKTNESIDQATIHCLAVRWRNNCTEDLLGHWIRVTLGFS